MLGSKGQSAIEYVTTYGWMLVAVSIVGGTMYTQVDINDGCQLTTTGFSPPFPTVTETYQYDNGTIFLEVTNSEEDSITLNNITIKDDDTTEGAIGLDKEVIGESKAKITTNRFQTSENCNERTLQINYKSNTLRGLAAKGTIQGKITITPLVALFETNTTTAQVDEQIKFNASQTEAQNTITEYKWEFGDGTTATGKNITHSYTANGAYITKLTVTDSTGIKDTAKETIYVGGVLTESGGTISQIGFQNTLATNCIGPKCANITGTSQESVQQSGDTLQGTLFTKKLHMTDTDMCITDTKGYGTDQGCSVYRQGPDTTVSEQNYKMNGSLKTPNIKPSQNTLCIGDNC